jgi:hypothetical protein
MHVNAMARSILINSGGVLEKILFSGEISMELSSKLYQEWRFDHQALPADLIERYFIKLILIFLFFLFRYRDLLQHHDILILELHGKFPPEVWP